MDDSLWDTQYVERILLDEFQQNELGDNVDIIDTFFEILKFASAAPLFGHGHQGVPNWGQQCYYTTWK